MFSKEAVCPSRMGVGMGVGNGPLGGIVQEKLCVCSGAEVAATASGVEVAATASDVGLRQRRRGMSLRLRMVKKNLHQPTESCRPRGAGIELKQYIFSFFTLPILFNNYKIIHNTEKPNL